MRPLTIIGVMALACALSAPVSADNLTSRLQHSTVLTPAPAKNAQIKRMSSPTRAPQHLRLPGQGMALTKGTSHQRAARTVDEPMFESFEYDTAPWAWSEQTADLAWLPEGWTRLSATGAGAEIDQWFAYPLQRYTMVPCYDGSYTMGVLFGPEYKDEWLVTPELTIAPDQWLTFGWYTVPMFLWVIDREHVDFDKGEFIQRELAATLKVMIADESGEWTELKDMADDYAHLSYDELTDIDPIEMMDVKISLAAYAGQRVKVAFRYVGTDGNSIFIDGVSVNNGKDRLDALYMPPMASQYAGGAYDGEIMDIGVQVHPVLTPLEWTNVSDNSPATTYTWDLAGLPVTSESEEAVTVEFPIPAATARQPFTPYFAPILSATGGGSRSTDYMEDVVLMAGGKSQVGDTIYGLLPFDLQSAGVGTHTAEPVDFGHRRIPIFGYSEDTDAWWRLYTCGGDEENLDHVPYAYVSGVINGIMASERPMVVKGAWLYAIGLVDDSARFRCSIYSLTEDGAFDRELATATLRGSDLLVLDTRTSLYYYSLPFDFGKQVVLDAEGTGCGLYAVMVSGFHDGGVEYFAPIMQMSPDRFERCFGFYQIEYMYHDQHTVGLSYVAFHEDENGPMYDAFAINLDAEYPWLQSETSEVELDGETTVALRSYYGGSDLRVSLADGSELPDYLSATVRGRFDDTKLTVRTYGETPDFDIDIVVTGPGVSLPLKLKSSAGITDITADGAEAVETYDLMGRKIAPGNQQRGIYITRSASGQAAKVVK